MSHHSDNGTLQVVGAAENPLIAEVWRLAEPVCRSEGMELIHVECRREQAGRIMRIFLDKPGGVNLDDCANISRQLGDIFDVALETQDAYRLEVSSPGIQRPLSKIDDFTRFKGVCAKVKTSHPINGQKNFSGILDGVSGYKIRLMVNRQSVSIDLGDIVKAHLLKNNGENACS